MLVKSWVGLVDGGFLAVLILKENVLVPSLIAVRVATKLFPETEQAIFDTEDAPVHSISPTREI